jgi:hypothetical protein
MNILKKIRDGFRRIGLRVRSREATFSRYHRENFWKGGESVSGQGSDVAQTRAVARELPTLLKKYNVKIMLDAPCGDFRWMRDVALPITQYIGADIVPDLTRANQKEYGNKQRRFVHADIVRDELPKADLILTRDVLVHLSYVDIRAAITNMKKSGATYLLTTTFPEHKNADIVTGEWRPLNLESAPFDFPKPIEAIDEKNTENDGQYADKQLALWRFADIET